jgi:hypothetical protein
LYQQEKRECRGVIIRHGMKIKIGSWADYDFDKDDAKIAVPLILLVLALTLTSLRKEWLLAGGPKPWAALKLVSHF